MNLKINQIKLKLEKIKYIQNIKIYFMINNNYRRILNKKPIKIIYLKKNKKNKKKILKIFKKN